MRSATLTIVVAFLLSITWLAVNAASPKPSKTAKKAFKQAERIMNDPSKAGEARKQIAEALLDSAYISDPKAYYIAGKIEATQYQEGMKKLSINRNDPNVDRIKMADALMSALKYYEKTISLDTVVDSKGNKRTTYSNQLMDWITNQVPQFYNSGIAYLNKKLYYPQAYNAFMAYAESPDRFENRNAVAEITDSARANGYFYAGVMAFNAGDYAVSAEAFEKARGYKYPKKEALINEMVCYRRLADADSTFLPEAMSKMTAIAGEGVQKYGLTTPMFIQKFAAGNIWSGEAEKAIVAIDSLLTLYPENASLLNSLRGEADIALNDTEAAIADYMKAASDSSASFNTLLNASKLLAAKGIEEADKVAGSSKAAKKKRKQIKDTWLVPAKEYAIRAREAANKKDGIYGEIPEKALENMLQDLDNTIATIDYNMLI